MNVSRLWPIASPLNHWGSLAGQLTQRPELPRPLLICLRGVRPFEDESHPMKSEPVYDDTGVFLSRDFMPEVFRMSSHAYQVNSRLSPDVNKDGTGDVGTILPGAFVLNLDPNSGKFPTWYLRRPDGDGYIPCSRDTNHNGIIDHDESRRIYTATQILLHGGIDDPPESPHHYSIGCQCAPLSARRLMLDRSRGQTIDYLLIRAEDALAAFTPPEPEGPTSVT